jgi:hypothetical protein
VGLDALQEPLGRQTQKIIETCAVSNKPLLLAQKPSQFTCTLLAHLRKSFIINGAGEGNRTLVSGLGNLKKPGRRIIEACSPFQVQSPVFLAQKIIRQTNGSTLNLLHQPALVQTRQQLLPLFNGPKPTTRADQFS